MDQSGEQTYRQIHYKRECGFFEDVVQQKIVDCRTLVWGVNPSTKVKFHIDHKLGHNMVCNNGLKISKAT